MSGGHHLVAEAPTGSGKSLAYLAPAIASGKKVVIATATLTLQDQLWQKDLPHLHEHGGVAFTAAVLKGRSQYVCHAKLERARTGDALFDERPGPSFDVDVARLVRFAASSESGDLAGVDIADASRRAASCAPMECPGATKCSHGDVCFAERARKRSTEADILVVNHAFYCVHLESSGAVLPEHDLVVFDEAHGLADVATTTFGIDVTPAGLRQLASRLTGVGVASNDAEPLGLAADALTRAIERSDGRVDPTGGAFADALGAAAERLAAAIPSIDASGDPERRSTDEPARRRPARGVAPAPVARHRRGGLGRARRDPPRADRRVARARRRVCSRRPRPCSRRRPSVAARASPPSPAGSASIRTPSPDRPPSPHPTARRCSCRGSATWTWPSTPRSTSVHRRSSTSPATSRSRATRRGATPPRPRPPGSSTRRADARSILCTSRAAVERMAARLRDETDHPVLVQGETSKAVLLERFAAEEASCLVATRSFWTGVDVPGPSCVLVVLDRLPFARPDDPLAQARREKAERGGGSGFGDVDLPAAALVLAQGAGRLIRTVTDRGVVAVLDRRLATAQYRKVLLDALPPMRRVVDPEIVGAFLATCSA